MTAILLSQFVIDRYGDQVRAALPRQAEYRLLAFDDAHPPTAAERGGIEAAFLSLDMLPSARGSRACLEAFFETLTGAPNLRWLQLAIAGADILPFERLAARGVAVTSASGANAASVAHAAVAGVLALARGVPAWVDAQRERRWQPYGRERVPADLDGTTAVIVGLGEIGRRIARACRGLDMRVVGVRRHAQPDVDCDEVVTPERLPAIAEKADWLIFACPLTEQTRNLANRELLARLPAHARVINVGRGGVVDEDALLEALREGRLAGAYLDVFATEPLPADSPLWDAPNLLISPHVGGASRGFAGRGVEIFIDNLRQWTHGEALRNLVRFD